MPCATPWANSPELYRKGAEQGTEATQEAACLRLQFLV